MKTEKTKKPVRRNQIGIRTYSLIKYVATIGSVLLLVAPLLSLVYFWKGLFDNNLNTLNAVTFTLWTVGFLVLGFYVALRIHLFFMTKYKYLAKEKLLLWMCIGFYISVPFISLIYLCLANFSSLTNSTKSYLAIFFLILLLLVNMVAAILESFSRIGEQRFLVVNFAKKKPTISMSEAGVERTKEAQQLLKEETKSKTKLNVKDAKQLEDFLNDDQPKGE